MYSWSLFKTHYCYFGVTLLYELDQRRCIASQIKTIIRLKIHHPANTRTTYYWQEVINGLVAALRESSGTLSAQLCCRSAVYGALLWTQLTVIYTRIILASAAPSLLIHTNKGLFTMNSSPVQRLAVPLQVSRRGKDT